MDELILHEYEVLVIAHFIYRGYDFKKYNVMQGVRDLVYFREFYDTTEEALQALYPEEVLSEIPEKEKKRR